MCAALTAVSPIHWICSARLWLDMPLTTLTLVAVWCQVRGARQASWLPAAGFFWGCAVLTKYVAFVAWLGATQPRVFRHQQHIDPVGFGQVKSSLPQWWQHGCSSDGISKEQAS